VTDIHGANRVFRKFLNSLKMYKADVGIIGGDVMGKRLIPVIQNSDGTFTIEYFGQNRTIETAKAETDLIQMESTLNDVGFYTYRMSAEEFVKLSEDQSFLEKIFENVMLNRLNEWIALTASKLQGTSIKVFMSGGNDDLPIIDTFLRRHGPLIYCESDVVKIDKEHEMISSGYGNMTPWHCPRDIPEEELETRLETIISRVENIKNCIFNIHVPPIGTALDECPKLDTSVSPPRILVGETTHGGSTAVRKVIEKYQPLVSLHGHIHESRGVEKIGRTICINPGSEYSEGILKGVLVNFDKDKIKGYQFTNG
jgi:Icc-related predicted phosphoesterase